MLTIISYQNPDLDGVACAFAYAEFLKKKGKEVRTGTIGVPHREALFALKKVNIQFNEIKLTAKDQIVFVDASELLTLPKGISPSQVIEIIDHRKANEADKFPNAKVQIELVGAAATLVAERFYNEKIIPSKEAASLLFLAIASNTINFKTNNTTARDVKMANWLKNISKQGEKDIHEMFMQKSQITNIFNAIDEDFATFDLKERVGIAQLEILNAQKFIESNKEEIENALRTLKEQEKQDLAFLTCIDLEKAENYFLVIDAAKTLLEKIGATFKENVGKRNGIVMRKEIVPLIKTFLQN